VISLKPLWEAEGLDKVAIITGGSRGIGRNTTVNKAATPKSLLRDCKLRRVKYLNNVIDRDPRFIKKIVRASQCFKRFHTVERTLEGIEAVNMLRKGQVTRLAGSHTRGLATFVASLFGVAA